MALILHTGPPQASLHRSDQDHGACRALIAAADKPLVGFVDAAVSTIVERLGELKLATLDRHHFGLLRPRHCDALSSFRPDRGGPTGALADRPRRSSQAMRTGRRPPPHLVAGGDVPHGAASGDVAGPYVIGHGPVRTLSPRTRIP